MRPDVRPALFLDRDGVLNADKGYVAHVADFEWIPGAKACVKRFNDLGYWVFVVTNQSGIARGYYSERDMHALHEHMRHELAAEGARVDQFYYCPYHPESEIADYRLDSEDRKPKPGMLLRAMADFPVEKRRSLMIGDKDTDIQAARAAGVRGFLFAGGDLLDFAARSLSALG